MSLWASLRAGDEVDVVVLVLHLLHPVADRLGEFGLRLQPRRVEAQRERGAVALVVLLQVLHQASKETQNM